MEKYDLEGIEYEEGIEDIVEAFSWADTPEGEIYWGDAYSICLDTGKLPEEAQMKFDVMKEQAKKEGKKMTTTMATGAAPKKDFMGQKLKVGDTIAYVRYGYLSKAIIESFTPKYARIGKGNRAALDKCVKVQKNHKVTPDLVEENKALRDYIAKLSLSMVEKEAA